MNAAIALADLKTRTDAVAADHPEWQYLNLLRDILDTEVSPELVPGDATEDDDTKQPAQSTESVIGQSLKSGTSRSVPGGICATSPERPPTCGCATWSRTGR